MSVAVRIPVVDSSQPGEARRMAIGMALKMGFDETDTGKVAIVVTECATNLVKHGGGGEILLHPVTSGDVHGLEVIAVDRGGGMADIEKSLRDGESTSGTSGEGLGAIVRLSSFYDLYSRPGGGTVLLAQFWPGRHRSAPTACEVGGFSVAMMGEEVSGDSWSVRHGPRGCSILVVDGLGHGQAAADAAREAVLAFQESTRDTPVQCMEVLHARLRSTRGAAAAIATVDIDARRLSFVGVGNIAGVVTGTPESKSLVSMSGTLGHNLRVVREFFYPWSPQSRLILHSDGVSGRWDLGGYPGLMQSAPVVAAAALYRDMARGKDDATVVVVRESGAAA